MQAISRPKRASIFSITGRFRMVPTISARLKAAGYERLLMAETVILSARAEVGCLLAQPRDPAGDRRMAAALRSERAPYKVPYSVERM